MRLNRSVIPLALASVMLGACGDGGDAQRPLPEVKQAAVTEAAFTEDVDTVSTLEAVDLVQLAAQASGRIIELKITQGDRVSPGQLLMTLDQAQEQAKLAGLKAKEQKDLLELKRYEFLVPLGAAEASERDQRRAIYIASREEVRAQEATLASKVLLRISLVNGSPFLTTSPTCTETSATVPAIGDCRLL